MATTKAITGNAIKHNNGTILHAGNVNTSTGPIQSDLSLGETTYAPFYGSRGILADGSPLESGTIGTMKANSNGTFNKMEDGKYVAKILGTRVAGVTNNVLRSGASDIASRKPLHYARGNRRYDITSWSYTTGAATKGGSAGALVTYIDPETGSAQAMEPKPTKAVPGRLVFMVTGKTATKTTYSQNNA
jgi:hypothetical protein